MAEQPSISVVQLTPPGRGAVATVRVQGPEARQIVQRHFTSAAGAKLSNDGSGRIIFGHWNGPLREEIIVSERSPDQLDLHCHGGQVVVDLVLRALIDDGCPQVQWRQSATAHEDPIQHAARVALAEARTERTASILLDQYDGALGRELDRIVDALEHDSSAAVKRLRDLSRRAGLGRHLVEPWRIVLSGPPNVGKSSLINALVGYQRALVFHEPGTTRDVVTVLTAIDGWPVELADTAGLRVASGAAEAAGVKRAEQSIAEADLIVFVFDGTRPWSDTDRRRTQSWPKVVWVYNKCDLGVVDDARPAGIATSALAGEGIGRLTAELARRLVPDPPSAGEAVPFTAAQADAVEEAWRAAKSGDFRGAGDQLRRLSCMWRFAATGNTPFADQA